MLGDELYVILQAPRAAAQPVTPAVHQRLVSAPHGHQAREVARVRVRITVVLQQLLVRRPGLKLAHDVDHTVLLVGRMELVFLLGSVRGRVRLLLEDGRGSASHAADERPMQPGQSSVRHCSMSGFRGSIVLASTSHSRRPMPLQDSYFFTLLRSFGCRISNHEVPRSSV